MVSKVLRTDIPNDWNVITLGDYAQIFRGGSPRPIQSFLTTSDQGINWIKIGDVGAGEKFIESTEEKIIPEGVSRSRMVYKGDLILSNSMSYGRPYIMNIEGCIHDGWLVIQKYDRLFNREYLYYALSSDLTMRQYVAMAAGSSVQNLNKEKVSKVVLPCPKISEQKKIAEVLSSIDALIVDLQKLIRKKKDVLYGSMQKLMTGEIRLQGFSEEWELVEIGSVAKVIDPHPSHRAPEAVEYGIPFVGIGDIDEEGNINKKSARIVDESVYTEHSQRYDLSKNLIGIGRVASLGKVIRLRNDIGEYVISPTMAIIDFESIDPMFAYYYMRSSEFQNQFTSSSNGSTRQSVGMHYIRNLNIRKPSPEEQVKLSQCLGDMDYEIRKLEEKCSKYQKVKQGMMEELLTGKVRLV